jgi:multidrug transporter EmrE-like cation transporter
MYKKMDYLKPSIGDAVTLNLIKGEVSGLPILTGAYSYHTLGDAVKKNGIGVANASWNIMSTALCVISGYFIWNEQLTTKKIMGIGLGMAGLYLMN